MLDYPYHRGISRCSIQQSIGPVKIKSIYKVKCLIEKAMSYLGIEEWTLFEIFLLSNDVLNQSHVL